jgi:hypothetical protein
LSKKQLVDLFFLGNRTRILEIAAFLDRLDRAGCERDDFRMEAFRQALQVLCAPESGRIHRAQMVFSDTTVEFLEESDQKSADGAAKRVGVE